MGVAVARKRLALSVLGPSEVFLGAIVAVVLFGALSPYPSRPVADAIDPHQLQATPPFTLTVNVHHNEVSWHADPGQWFGVSLHNESGLKGEATATADRHGLVRAGIHVLTNQDPVRISPGDRLEVQVGDRGPAVVSLDVPKLSVDVSDEGDQVAGLAPPGVELAVLLDDAPLGEASLSTSSDTMGRFTFEVPESKRPFTGGRVQLETADGHTFQAMFASRALEMWLGTVRAEGRVTLETAVRVQQSVDGSPHHLLNLGRTFPPDGSFVLTDYPYRAQPIGPGSLVTVTHTGGPLHRNDTVSLTMPDLAVTLINPTLIAGVAPAGVHLEVVITDRDGELVVFPAEIDVGDDRAFEWVVPDNHSIEAGERIGVRLRVAGWIVVRAEVVVPQVRLAVGAADVSVIASPLRPITVTHWNRLGEPLVAVGGTDSLGLAQLALDTGEVDSANNWDVLRPLMPGDVVEAEIVTGDPVRLEVPRLTARTRQDAQSVEGEAPPGAEVILQQLPGGPRSSVTAGSDGKYVFDIEEQVRLTTWSEVAVSDTRGHEYYRWTAPASLRISLGQPYVYFSPVFGYPVTVTLETEAGTAGTGTVPLQRLEARNVGLHGLAWLEDSLGTAARPAIGDRLRLASGAEEAVMDVPPLTGVIHVEDDVVAGHTLPNTEVTVDTAWDQPGNVQATAMSDATGIYRVDFGGAFDIAYNSAVSASIVMGLNTATRDVAAPGLAVTKNVGLVEGSLEPDASLLVSLSTPPRASFATRADDRAGFEGILRTPSGEPVEALAGETVTVASEGSIFSRDMTWTIPELSLRLDAESSSLEGTSDPGARLDIYQTSSLFYPGIRAPGFIEPVVNVDGSWSVEAANFASQRGIKTRATLLMPSGHVAAVWQTNPLLNVRHGGSIVCGAGQAFDQISVQARDGTGVLATARGTADELGHFEVEMTSASGQPFVTRENVVISASIGKHREQVFLGPLETVFDPEIGRLDIRAQPGASLTINMPSRSCLYRERRDSSLSPRGTHRYTASVEVPDNGRHVRSEIRPELRDAGVDVAVFTPDGHRYYKTAYLPIRLLAYVDTERLRVQATPGSEVTATLLTDSGERFTRQAVAGEEGNLEIRFALEDDEAVIRPGHLVVVESGGASVSTSVIPLSFDFSRSGGLSVRGPAEAPLKIWLEVGLARPVKIETRLDHAGFYRLGPDDMPTRAGWDIDSIAEIQVIVPDENGQATAAEWFRESAPTPHSAYIPAAANGG